MKLSQFQIRVCLNLLDMPSQNVACGIEDLKIISKTADALDSAKEPEPELPTMVEGKNKSEKEKIKKAYEKEVADWNEEYDKFSLSKTSIGFDEESTELLKTRILSFKNFSPEKKIRSQLIDLAKILGV